MANIFHVTSVHPRYDTRIFKKECLSLVQQGHDVTLVVCDGLGNETKDSVFIVDMGISNEMGRLKRFRILPGIIFNFILRQESVDFVHFHDPELMFIGSKLSKKGIKVIYDVHEYVPKQILTKPYLPSFTRKLIAWMLDKIEMTLSRKFYAVVTVTEELVERFQRVNGNVFLCRNYPVVSSFTEVDFNSKQMVFLYAGGITTIRGAIEMGEASSMTDLLVRCFGPVESELEAKLRLYKNLVLEGNVRQEVLFDVYRYASVGLIILHKVPNHMVSSPNKLLEYMAAGMAVIASDIPIWQEMIENEKCGICVDPYNVEEIANAMKYMKEHPDEVKRMGMNGRKAVIEKYSWESEESTLFSIYTKL